MREKKVELPLTEPLCSTYHYQGIGGAVLQGNPSVNNWYLNNAIQLSCNRAFIGKFSTPEISIKNSSFWDNPHLEKYVIPMKYLGGYIHHVIRNLLFDGYYVFFNGIDDFYIKGKSCYQTLHNYHDGLIHGFDSQNKTYKIYAYDESWVFGSFDILQEHFELSRKSCFAKKYYGSICGIKPYTERVSIDLRTIYDGLTEYLQSSWEKYPPYKNEFVYGSIVHDYIAVYLFKHIWEAFPYERKDRRVFRVVWEHKKVMLERIKAVEKELGLSEEFSQMYAPIVALSDRMRMLYASHMMKRRDSILRTLRNDIIELKNKEKAILEPFLICIKEKI